MKVFGRSLGFHAPASLAAFGGWSNEEGGGGATRYARPCRPVNPLLMIEVVGIRSARHLVQRRFVVGFAVRKEVGVGGEEEGEVETVHVDCAELRRRRKGMLGRR